MFEERMQEDSPARPEKAVEQEHLIDELASAEDRWLTVSQAARVSGQSEATIERWINQGLLPVQRRSLESNNAVRLVRASDLALLNASAALSSTAVQAPAPALHTQAEERDHCSQQEQPGSDPTRDVDLVSPELFSHEVAALRRLIREQALRQHEALERLRSRLEARLQQQQEAATQQRLAVDEALTRLQTSFEDEIAALQIQTSTRQTELEQQLEELTTNLQRIHDQWQHTLTLLRQQIDALTTHVQQEVEAQEQLTREVLHLTTQLAEQRIQQEQMTHTVGQLTQQLTFLTAQVAEQRQRLEQQHERQDQYGLQMSRLERELEDHRQDQQEAQQEVLGVLAGQQEQLGNLLLRLNEQTQRYELLSQLYLNVEQQQGEHERQLRRLYRLLEHFSPSPPSVGFSGHDDLL
ncbi:helix-turn-helix domain-containing protein [Thermogemmatispora sp.]|uniref:helix-turn-helix domain-containing protein n=1 Tax=Thermogemmatispora sp. TaxID=1968838 RepID=UPI001DD754C2|nr:helix-turn-helix domain-containing protein [Thermogemmatispora sp.]MBX5448429.1 hypothetical protein [Thermogemmatispora sp.]